MDSSEKIELDFGALQRAKTENPDVLIDSGSNIILFHNNFYPNSITDLDRKLVIETNAGTK